MFKVGRWKHDKIKVLFSLQFQATQLPCSKSKLMISLIPMDVGQPTVRLKKAVVKDGICTWENPVYETVKFTREIKTGIVQDKFYQFIISTGSSKKGFFGEVLVNFADFLDATSPTLIYQPINSSDAGAILHITIQNMQAPDDQRELQRETDENGGSISHHGSLQGQDSNSQSVEDMIYNDHEDLYYNATNDLDNEDWKITRNRNLPVPDNNNKPSPADKNYTVREPLTLDWSSDDDLANYVDNTDKSSLTEQEPPKSLVEQLKNEISNLKRQAEFTDIELSSLRMQVAKETKRAQELSEQVIRLREERDAFRKESEKHRSELNAENGIEHPKGMITENEKPWHRQNEDAVDLVHAKELNRGLRSQLRKTQDSNSELILVVRGLEEKLGKKEKELANLTAKMKSGSKPKEFRDEDSDSSDSDIDYKEVNLLEQQIRNLQGDLEDHLKENRKLKEQTKQFCQDLEIAKQENDDLSSKFNQKQLELIKKERQCTQNMRKVEELESQIARFENMIQKQSDEFFESSNVIHDLELQVKRLKNELQKQEENYEDEIKAIINVNVDLEQRALQAEDKLKRTKLDNDSAEQSQSKERENELEELLRKYKDESVELENMNRRVEDKCEALSNENQALRTEVERLAEENYNITKMLQEMNTLVDEMKNSIQESTRDREELETKYAIARTEIDQPQEELKVLRSLTKNDYAMAEVQTELEKLQVQHNELKTRSSETKMDNENLREQLTRQKENLQRKDQELANLEKIKESSSKEVSALKEKVKQLKAIRPSGISENGSKLHERKSTGKLSQLSANSAKPLENGASRTKVDRDTDSQKSDLLTEVALLKEKNKTTEDELRDLQQKYLEVSLKFAEVENERQQLVMTIRSLRNDRKQ